VERDKAGPEDDVPVKRTDPTKGKVIQEEPAPPPPKESEEEPRPPQ
jgi:hypothetical protein